MRLRTAVVLALLGACIASGASAGTRTRVTPLWQNLSQLPPGEGNYELWIIKNGVWKSFGQFLMDTDAKRMKSPANDVIDSLEVDGDWTGAQTMVVSVELTPDPDPLNANGSHVLAGDIHGTVVDTLKTAHSMAIGAVFDGARCYGSFHIDSPSDDCTNTADWNSGVWFYKTTPLSSTLVLPTLPSTWQYELWVGDASTVDQIPYSCGTLSQANPVASADCDGVGPYQGVTTLAAKAGCETPNYQSACGSSTTYNPAFPGDDFVATSIDPSDLGRPVLPEFVQASGTQDQWLIVMSVEPVPNPGPSPFQVEPLQILQIPPTLGHNVSSNLQNFATTLPRGSATIALVQSTPARPTSWGAIKAQYGTR